MPKYWQVNPDPGSEFEIMVDKQNFANDRRYLPTDQVATDCADGDDLERGYGYLPALHSLAGNFDNLWISQKEKIADHHKLLWTVNIGLRRKIPLLGVFSGAAFVIMASIIRAVTILKVRRKPARFFSLLAMLIRAIGWAYRRHLR